ncbi:immunoglobulin-like domain-containing protein [Pueribacillus sp. YX66]|uniref:immunoglobulin-like domain-containing protein n=1 Tax=Pueribacillus sp. YX66 TaxID=3229242 RepID=UPI00358D79CC
MKHVLRSIYSLLFSFILILSIFSSHAFAERPTLQYVALGDSLAAGFLNSQELGDGYPVYIAEGIEEETPYYVNLINYGVGGYTTVHLLEQLERSDVQQDLSNADFITIDIGANDILWKIGTDFDLSDPEELNRIIQEVNEAISTVKTNVTEILSQIKQLNPEAPIFFMGYYNALPYLDGQEMIELMISILNSALQDASEETIFVPTFDAFNGKHDIYLPNPNDIHPTKEGYEVIASLFLTEILPILPPVSSILEITLHGDNPLELEVGEPFIDPGASAYDSIDGDLTDAIKITGEVNTNEAGTYTLTYTVTNSLGETVSADRIVHVMKVDDSANDPPPQVKPKQPQPPTNDSSKNDTPKKKEEPKITTKTSKTTTGEKLPSTATTYPTFILIGILLTIAGCSFFIMKQTFANRNIV